MTVESFHPDHLREIDLQDAQKSAAEIFDDAEYIEAISSGVAVTVRGSDGKIVACGGSVEIEGVSLLWSFLSKDASKSMVSIVRAARRLIDVSVLPVVATAACDFAQGCRMLEMMGLVRQPDTVEDVAIERGPHYVYMRTA